MTLRQEYAKAAMKGLLVGMIREGDRYPART